jgi:hypothetical protein
MKQLPQEITHYRVGRYITHQPDSVHIEARCSCGARFEGIGGSESEELVALWNKYKKRKALLLRRNKYQLYCPQRQARVLYL